MTAALLKIIACVTMFLDHLGLALVYGGVLTAEAGAYTALRAVGRIAFPLFGFLLAEGVRYTKNPKKYLLRIFFAAILSEIPFDWAIFRTPVTFEHQNVLWTLLFGLAAVLVLRQSAEKEGQERRIWRLLSLAAAAIACFLGWICHTDYGWCGVLAVILIGHTALPLPKLRLWGEIYVRKIFFAVGLAVLWAKWPNEIYAFVGLVFLSLYNGRKGYSSKWIQGAFYAFYPVHLLLLAIAVRLLG